MILTAAFVTGYAYARLSRDEYARRRAYSRYTNLMLLFDEVSKKYEYHWGQFIDFCCTFDHTYLLWKYRHQKWAEWKARRKLEPEIYKKHGQEDEVSGIIMQMDNVQENTVKPSNN